MSNDLNANYTRVRELLSQPVASRRFAELRAELLALTGSCFALHVALSREIARRQQADGKRYEEMRKALNAASDDAHPLAAPPVDPQILKHELAWRSLSGEALFRAWQLSAGFLSQAFRDAPDTARALDYLSDLAKAAASKVPGADVVFTMDDLARRIEQAEAAQEAADKVLARWEVYEDALLRWGGFAASALDALRPAADPPRS